MKTRARPLLEPDARRIGRPPGPQAPDRAPDSLAQGTPQPLRDELVALLGKERVLCRAIDLIAYASDASPYRRFPAVVVMAHDAGDVGKVLAYARRTGTPVNFRGGGTSLNGQAQTDGIMIDVRRWFSGVKVEDGGERARLRAGTLLGVANRVLERRGFKLGPDPASKDIATIGGVIANNSGGMRCGVTWDSYSTVESMTLVLASGTVIDTAEVDAEQRFAEAEPRLAAGLLQLRDELLADSELSARVRRKFEIKNVTGYRLCALLDAETPLEIFRRLVVGSEGTLAFVSEAVMRTRPEPPRTTLAWAHFKNIDDAAAAVPALVAAGARATELMVAPALIAAAWNMDGCPEYWRELPFESAALIVEFGGEDGLQLDAGEAAAERALAGHELIRPLSFTRAHEEIELTWTVREGLFGLVGRLRAPGSALIIEDVCVRPERIAECARDLQALLGKHEFLVGVAGHASAGNLHFQLTPDFAKPEDVERYEQFMEELVELIVGKYDGSLKAEHGTGVNMAPYVEREWGAKATQMMWQIKQLADPHGVLNPGVVLNRDPHVHLKHLKSQPPIEESASHCVECGFCEPVCPSRNATTTPRQRIVIRREMARQAEGSPVYEALMADYEYDALQTCAADGSCQAACPVAIDTGALVKEFRRRERSDREESVALVLADRYASVERAARGGLAAAGAAASLLGDRGVAKLGDALRRRVTSELVPAVPASSTPPPAASLPETAREGAAAVYLPACINRIFGNPPGLQDDPSLPQALVTVSARAGLPVWIPHDAAGHCCATPWSSKGYRRGQDRMAAKTAAALWRWSDGGELPVVIDASSCALGLLADVGPRLPDAERERFERIEVLDSIAWAHDRLLAGLDVTSKLATLALHPTCSVAQLGLGGKLRAVANALADEVVVPAASTCCGMAGDRGLLHPELPASAMRDAAAELSGRRLDAHVCSNRTCEIGLQQTTGAPYASFVLLLERLTRPTLSRHADPHHAPDREEVLE
ncbi:MAG TPA: FAD-binding and (Fe-S)-binding domain-containing protein [Solirubrobacteraceae bacterium]|nr:FAD-binding and (Fe-S)-binding domain-containing protein [Solirubrobacteraceae bacterium]